MPCDVDNKKCCYQCHRTFAPLTPVRGPNCTYRFCSAHCYIAHIQRQSLDAAHLLLELSKSFGSANGDRQPDQC